MSQIFRTMSQIFIGGLEAQDPRFLSWQSKLVKGCYDVPGSMHYTKLAMQCNLFVIALAVIITSSQ